MLKPGSQRASSTSWKSPRVGSKSAQTQKASPRSARVKKSAIQRAFRATSASVPRSTIIQSTAASGRKMTRLRIAFVIASPDQRQQVIPRHQHDDADQHGEGVVVEIPRLQPAHDHRDVQRGDRDSVRSESVDDGTVALLPQATAQPKCRPDEQEIVKLVEI